jgi:hypothetical protein
VKFVRRFFLRRKAILAARPAAQVDHLAPFAAEGTIGIFFGGGLFFARGALHGETSLILPEGGTGALLLINCYLILVKWFDLTSIK